MNTDQPHKKISMRARILLQLNAGRVLFAAASLVLQILWLYGILVRFQNYNVLFSGILQTLSVLVVLRIYGKYNNSAFKLPWIIVILVIPIFGIAIYLLYGRSGLLSRYRKRFEAIDQELFPLMPQNPEVMRKLEQTDFLAANQCRYTGEYGHYPVYGNTDAAFYNDAADGLEAQLAALAQAKKFIFMEYHAIEDGAGFGRMKQMLLRKAAEGVEVRLIYDDMGSIHFLTPQFKQELEAGGIACRVFNPIHIVYIPFMNNRDHRKITVIDGQVGFLGGYNLADRYFHLEEVYGYWKDSGIRLEGDAVRSLTISFLEMWNALKKSDEDYRRYLPPITYRAHNGAFVQPYADSPLDGEHVGENVYLHMIKNAKHYIWFTTPYLVITDDMSREMRLAAKRGVDVRIITPGIPDKKMAYAMTRSYYGHLVRDGVKIYEYTPGFCHAKQCLCDDEIAVVGTINLDYRSLYLHFENGCWIYRSPILKEIREDFEEMFRVSEEVNTRYKNRSYALRIGQCLLRLVAPLF